MITRTFNADLVNSILSDPVIWEAISPVPYFESPHLPECLYFMVNEGDGVIIAHPFRDSLKLHPNILPKYRGRIGYQAIEDTCQELFAMGYPCIYVEIDRSLRHIALCARQLGFKLLESNERDIFIRRNLDS